MYIKTENYLLAYNFIRFLKIFANHGYEITGKDDVFDAYVAWFTYMYFP